MKLPARFSYIEPLESRIAPAAVANIDLSTLDGTIGFKLSGVTANDFSGRSVSAAGDVNGDGFDDLLIGAFGADPNGSDSGASYVVFGKAGGFAPNLNLSTLDGTTGFKMSGVTVSDQAGSAVSAAGDVNGDGFDDLLIGARFADSNGSQSGASYVVFGKASGFVANLNLSTLDGTNGFKISGVAAYDRSGNSVSDAGDVNGDGFDDLLIGAREADPNGGQSGASYVVFGKASGFAANLNLSTLDGTNGFNISGVMGGDQSGDSVSKAGDVNGDGFDDLLIGAFGAAPNGSFSGASYVVFGFGTVNLSKVTDGAETNLPTAGKFRVTQSVATGTDTILSYTIGGTAASGSDFAALTGTVTILAGQTTTDIDVTVLGDSIVEETETLALTLTGVTSGATLIIIAPPTASLDITDDDTATVTIAKFLDGAEGASVINGSFRVTQSLVSATDTVINYSVPGGIATSGVDFTALAGSAIIPAGQTTADINVVVLNDFLLESAETVIALLTGFGAHDSGITLGGVTAASLEITDDEIATVTVARLADGEEADTPTNGLFRVTQSLVSSTDTVINYSIGGSATSGLDFTTLSGTVTILAGQTTADIDLVVLDDGFLEQTESVEITLTGFGAHDANITLGATTASLAITDVNTPVFPGISADFKRATFTDVDGDIVTVTVSRGTLSVSDFTIFANAAGGGQFSGLDLTDTGFAKANVTITAKPGPNGGDGLVNLGFLNAAGNDLGKVSIKGDLARIDVGDENLLTNALTSLTLKSMGRFGDGTQLGIVPGFVSNIIGSLPMLKVTSDLSGITLNVSGKLGSAKITGLIEESAILVAGGIKALSVKGSITESFIRTTGDLKKLSIGGNLEDSTISALGDINPATVGLSKTIGAISVKGRVANSSILAGYNMAGVATNADVQIGALTVGTDWIASNLIAGVEVGVDLMFGTADDTLIAGGNTMIAKIAKIIIKGHAFGTFGATDHFGFVAQQIGSFKFAGAIPKFLVGAGNDTAGFNVGPTLDLTAREVA